MVSVVPICLKVAGSIPGQGAYKSQAMNESIHELNNKSTLTTLSLKSINKNFLKLKKIQRC